MEEHTAKKEKHAEIIRKIYTDPSGFGSVANTWKAARKVDPSITNQEVKEWIEQHTERKTNLTGYNSYIPPRPHYEYQIDLFFMSDLKDEEQRRFTTAMCAIDSFTKFLTVVPMPSKKEPDFLAGLMQCFNNLGGKPQSIYADDEGSWHGKYVLQFMREEGIQLITTLSHAGIVESAIRTIKSMLYKRLDHDPTQLWHKEVLQQVVFVYNHMRTQSTVQMTPKEATKPENETEVKANIIRHANFTRDYPKVEVGDHVKIFRKKDKLDKQQKSLWPQQRYRVEEIRVVNEQNFYVTTWNDGRPLLRNEILKV